MNNKIVVSKMGTVRDGLGSKLVASLSPVIENSMVRCRKRVLFLSFVLGLTVFQNFTALPAGHSDEWSLEFIVDNSRNHTGIVRRITTLSPTKAKVDEESTKESESIRTSTPDSEILDSDIEGDLDDEELYYDDELSPLPSDIETSRPSKYTQEVNGTTPEVNENGEDDSITSEATAPKLARIVETSPPPPPQTEFRWRASFHGNAVDGTVVEPEFSTHLPPQPLAGPGGSGPFQWFLGGTYPPIVAFLVGDQDFDCPCAEKPSQKTVGSNGNRIRTVTQAVDHWFLTGYVVASSLAIGRHRL